MVQKNSTSKLDSWERYWPITLVDDAQILQTVHAYGGWVTKKLPTYEEIHSVSWHVCQGNDADFMKYWGVRRLCTWSRSTWSWNCTDFRWCSQGYTDGLRYFRGYKNKREWVSSFIMLRHSSRSSHKNGKTKNMRK